MNAFKFNLNYQLNSWVSAHTLYFYLIEFTCQLTVKSLKKYVYS